MAGPEAAAGMPRLYEGETFRCGGWRGCGGRSNRGRDTSSQQSCSSCRHAVGFPRAGAQCVSCRQPSMDTVLCMRVTAGAGVGAATLCSRNDIASNTQRWYSQQLRSSCCSSNTIGVLVEGSKWVPQTCCNKIMQQKYEHMSKTCLLVAAARPAYRSGAPPADWQLCRASYSASHNVCQPGTASASRWGLCVS